MSRQRLEARFFASHDGRVIERARPLTAAQRRAIFRRDGGRCYYCDARVTWTRIESRGVLTETRPGHVDHVIPRARGGQNDPSNLVLACERCNESKQAS